MKTSTRLAAIVALAGPAAAHLHLPFASRSTHNSPAAAAAAAAAPQLQRRSSSSAAKITHVDTSYSSSLVNLTVGTPPQDVALLLSVDEYVTWVPDATYCTDKYNTRYQSSYLSCDYGSFNVNLSSSWARDLDGDGYDQTFDASYAGYSGRYTAGNYASGKNLRETVGFAGASVPNVTLGLASSADQFVGMLGLGFNESERSYSGDQRPTFLDSMLAAGLVETKAYSVWLDDEAGAAGNLLLGAVDKSAFAPPLVRYDMGGSGGSSSYSSSYGDSISVDIASVNTSAAADGPLEPFQNKTRLPTVNIDPFSPLSYLPGPLAKKTWDLAGAVWDEDNTWATIPCSAREDAKARIAVQFGDQNGPVISLPVSDLVLPADPWYASSYGRYSRYASDTPSDTCVFGIQSPDYDPNEDEANFYSSASSSSSYTIYVAGAALLRRAYVVLDLANKELALAPVKSGASSTPADVVSFASYGALMPESTSHRCLSGNSYYSDNCTGEYAGTGPGSRSGSGYSGDDDGGSFGGLGKGQVIGLIVGLSIMGLTMLAVAIWGIIQCTRDNRKYSAEAMKEAQIGGAEPASVNAPSDSSAPAPAAAQSQPTRAAPP